MALGNPLSPNAADGLRQLASIPETITAPAEAEPLVRMLEQHVPHWRQLASGHPLNLPLWFERLELARGQGNEREVALFAGQILHGYPYALAALSQLIDGTARSAPAPITQSVAASSDAVVRPVVASVVEITAGATKPRRTRSSKAATTAAARLTTVVPMPMDKPDGARIAAVLRGAPDVFRLERLASGAAATVFEYVRRWKLYKDAGFATMRAYAAARLGVSESAYKDYARAGKAVWEHYTSSAQSVIDYVAGGVHAHPPSGTTAALPPVPAVSLLRELPRALRHADPVQRATILTRVETGEATYQELRTAVRANAGDSSGPAPGDGDEPADLASNDPDVRRPAVFDDVPEFKKATRGLRGDCKLLAKLVEVWSEAADNDVRTLLPAVTERLKVLDKVTTELENLMPTAACAPCKGAGCKRCAHTGWVPKSGAHPKKTSEASKRRAPKRPASRRKLDASKQTRVPARKKNSQNNKK